MSFQDVKETCPSRPVIMRFVELVNSNSWVNLVKSGIHSRTLGRLGTEYSYPLRYKTEVIA